MDFQQREVFSYYGGGNTRRIGEVMCEHFFQSKGAQSIEYAVVSGNAYDHITIHSKIPFYVN
jgi:hypothetical protein